MLKTEDILHSLQQLKLPPDLANFAIEYAMLSALPEMSEQSSDRISYILDLATQYRGFDLILNEIDRWCIQSVGFKAAQVDGLAMLDGNEIPLIDLLRRYALLSSQPILSEDAAHQISIILELAETNEVLALLLNEVDQLLLESTGLLSEEAQYLYANETSRILEFSPTIPETQHSEELLHLLSDQCANANQHRSPLFVLSKADYSVSSFDSPELKPPELTPAAPFPPPKHRSPLKFANKATRAGVEFISRRYKTSFLVAAFTTIAALMTGVTIAGRGCFTPERSLSAEQSINAPTESSADGMLVALLLKAATGQSLAQNGLGSGVALFATSGVQTAILDRQQFEERQQSVIEQVQSRIEQRQLEAEEKQIVAERQHRYKEAQQWYQEAQRNLKYSQRLRDNAQIELAKVRDLVLESRSTRDVKLASSRGLSTLQPRANSLFGCTLSTDLLMKSALFIVVLLTLSFTALWKREIN